MARWYHEAAVPLRELERFPIDMLRYESCYPKRQEDARAIEQSVDSCSNPKPTTVIVVKHTDSKRDPWTPARWESFGIRGFTATEARKG